MDTKRLNRPVVHLAASGGGHLELLSWLEHALEGCERVWVVSPGSRASALAHSGALVQEVPNPGRRISKFASNLRAALAALAKKRPRVVVTSGAGSVVPYSVLARMLGAEVIFIETMARVTDASMSGRVLSRIASSVLVQWPEMQQVYPGSIVCRPALCEEVAPRRHEGEGTFVAVGTHSEPFNRLLRLVDDAVGSGLLPGPVVAQAGVCTYRPRNYETVQWLEPDQIERAAGSARYVVCHAGSGVISSALRAGRRPMVLPRLQSHGEHFDDHQIQLASRLAELGLIVRLIDAIRERDVQGAASEFRPATIRPALPSIDEALQVALGRSALGLRYQMRPVAAEPA